MIFLLKIWVVHQSFDDHVCWGVTLCNDVHNNVAYNYRAKILTFLC